MNSKREEEKLSGVYRQLVQFAKEQGARKLVLFGSRARGDCGEKSDIDIAVFGCRDFAAFYDRVQEELWSLLEVDIINGDSGISPELERGIERDGRVLYEKV